MQQAHRILAACIRSGKCNRPFLWSSNYKIFGRAFVLESSTALVTEGNAKQSKVNFFFIKSCHSTCSTSTMASSDCIFQGSVDRFNGITIDSATEYSGCNEFMGKLEKSLQHWADTKRRTIWFKVRTQHSDWVPCLIKNGFEYHHAKAGYVILYRWLPTNETANLPAYAHTMVGVGGLVVNDKEEVLVISDKHALIPNSWKLPGGFVEPSENLVDAAMREVREETGVETVFNTVISVRHSHKGSFGCSDLYVVVGLRPTTLKLIPCEREIARIQWMPCAEYLEHPHVHETNRHFLRTFLDYRKRGICLTYESTIHQILKKEYALYYVKESPKNENDARGGVKC